MRLLFLGSGSAFTLGSHNFQSNMLLENDKGEHLLVDCGSDARHSLFEQGYTYKDVQSLFISHLHADHVGGLEWLALTSYYDPNCKRPVLYISEFLVHDLWDRVLSGGLSAIEGIAPTIDTFFDVRPIAKNETFTWSNIEFTLVKTIHIKSLTGVIPSYGLFLSCHNFNVFITSDTQFYPEQIKEFYARADVIFHDCETVMPLSGVHSHFSELISLDPSIKNKIWLYHYNPGKLPDALEAGFRGYVKKGQIFDFNDKATLI